MQENELTKEIIGAAIEVHRWLGPGLLEAVYEESLCHELRLRGISYQRQRRVPVRYKGELLSTEMRLDLLVDDRVIVDVKAKAALAPTDKPQLLTYLRLCDLRIGLLINFHVTALREGISRVMNGFLDESSPPNEPPDFHSEYIVH